MTVLTPEEWQPRAAAHAKRVREWTAPHLDRRSRGHTHAVWDFLFDYYSLTPAQLSRWHPGIGVELAGSCPHSAWRWYRTDPNTGITGVDTHKFRTVLARQLEEIEDLLTATTDNPAHFDCFGLHEWAMVYRTAQPRHDLPLRLGAQRTNEIVESHAIRCTHYDAFRFFTPVAKPLNITALSRADQPKREQRACVHATMDLYKWAYKLGPIVPGNLLLACFDLARSARVLDMEASPYDVTHLGFGVVPIETPAGKREYVARQRQLSEVAAPLRQQLLGCIRRVRGASARTTGTTPLSPLHNVHAN